MATSVRHYDIRVEDLLPLLIGDKDEFSLKFVGKSATGFRYTQMLEGKVDGYIQNRKGAHKWDTICGEVLLGCLGGKVSSVDGSQLEYGKEAQHLNCRGQLDCVSKEIHGLWGKRISEWYERNGGGQH